MKVRFNPEFKKKITTENYPLLGFFYCALDDSYEGDIESISSGEDLLNVRWSRTEVKTLPTIRDRDKIVCSFEKIKSSSQISTLSNKTYKVFIVLYLDMLDTEVPFDFLGQLQEYLPSLEVAFIAKEVELKTTAANYFELNRDYKVKAQLSRVFTGYPYLEHIEGNHLDKTIIYSNKLRTGSLIAKPLGEELVNYKSRSNLKGYNTFNLNPSGMIDM